MLSKRRAKGGVVLCWEKWKWLLRWRKTMHMCLKTKTTKNSSHSPHKTKRRITLWLRFWLVYTQRKWNQQWTDVSAAVFIVALLSVVKIPQLLLPVWDLCKIKPVKTSVMEVGEALWVVAAEGERDTFAPVDKPIAMCIWAALIVLGGLKLTNQLIWINIL